MVEQVARRGGRGLIPGNIQAQAGWGSELPDLGEDISAHCRGVDYMAQTLLWLQQYMWN